MERSTKILTHRWIKPHHVIIMMACIMILSFICGYAISVGQEKVAALFPYISDTGTIPPASCVFGLFLNIGGMLTFILIFLRHRQYERYHAAEIRLLHILNDIAMFLGYLSAIGALIVANFQETSLVSMHMVGAFMTFVIGILYCWLQSYLSIYTILTITRRIVYIRFILSSLSTIFFVMTVVFSGIASKRLRDSGILDNKDTWYVMHHWSSDEAGYDVHLVGTFSEWLMVFCFIFFFVTFYKEFKRMSAGVTVASNVLEELAASSSEPIGI